MICDGCKKIDVCKYTEQIKEFEKNNKINNLPQIIKVNYKCTHKYDGQLFRRNRSWIKWVKLKLENM